VIDERSRHDEVQFAYVLVVPRRWSQKKRGTEHRKGETCISKTNPAGSNERALRELSNAKGKINMVIPADEV
jgi:hypothetical protein